MSLTPAEQECYDEGTHLDWCLSCEICHHCDSLNPEALSFVTDTKGVDMTTAYTTQKANGLRWLALNAGALGLPVSSILARIGAPEWKAPTYAELTATFGTHSPGMIFARPCPVTPRHGFVESRVINCQEDLDRVIQESKAADPLGEVILTYAIKGQGSAILTPTLLTLGDGHDGATSGTKTTLMPFARLNLLGGYDLTGVGINPANGEAPYIEAVWSSSGPPTLVQLRSGPKITSLRPNYIPANVSVTKVIRPVESLLEWETLLKDAEPGTVIYHPGGSPADHYFVHARVFKIPVFTTHEPKVGYNYVAEPDDIPPPDPRSVADGIILGSLFSFPRGSASDAVTTLLYAMHNSAAMGGANAKWIGLGAALLLRLGTIALRGEARYIQRAKNGPHSSVGSRDTIYAKHWDRSIRQHYQSIPRLLTTFRFGSFSGGVGGTKWAQCAAALIPLFNAALEVVKTESAESVNKLIAAFNLAVNQAHNNGWWLNKFTAGSIMDEVQAGKVLPILKPVRFYRKIATFTVDPSIMERNRVKLSGLKPLSVRLPNFTKPAGEIIIESGALNIDIPIRQLRGVTKKVIIPLTDIGAALVRGGRAKFSFLRPKDDADPLRIIFAQEGLDAPPITVWEETPIVPTYVTMKDGKPV